MEFFFFCREKCKMFKFSRFKTIAFQEQLSEAYFLMVTQRVLFLSVA